MSIFTQLYKSMYSTKEMAKYRFQGIGKTILFVFFLSLISMIPSGIFMSSGFISGMNSLEQVLEEDIPSFKIKDGTITSSVDEPFIKETDDFVFILDGSDTTSVKDVQGYRNALALLEDKIILTTDYQSQSIDYSMFQGIVVTEDDLLSFIHTFESMLPIVVTIMIIFMFIVTSFLSFVEVAILGLFGLMLKNILGLKLKYRHTWILAAYSITIPTVFFTIMTALQIQVPYAGPLNWFVSTIVLYLVLKEIPKPKKKPTA